MGVRANVSSVGIIMHAGRSVALVAIVVRAMGRVGRRWIDGSSRWCLGLNGYGRSGRSGIGVAVASGASRRDTAVVRHVVRVHVRVIRRRIRWVVGRLMLVVGRAQSGRSRLNR